MSLKCGIIGLASTGKTTLFNCLSKSRAPAGIDVGGKTNLGQIEVPDYRLDKLYQMVKPEKKVATTVEIADIPGLKKGSPGKNSGNRFLADIGQTDALIHVLRCFEDDSVPHAEGSIDPLRDKEIVELELIFKDIETAEKKLEKYKKAGKGGDKKAVHGADLMSALCDHLENGQRAADFQIDETEKEYLDDCFLLSAKPVLYVCNVDDESAVEGNFHSDNVRKALKNENASILIIAARAEAEIAELEHPDDRIEFLKDIGIEEPGVNKLVRKAYGMLDLQTFFTIKHKEARAWTIRKGMTAPQAAGVVHTDLQRGFIRAEVMKYDDFVKLGSEQACKNAGKLFIEGKNYVVQDGDILNIRFNV